jgi:hypothetical protein
MWTWEDCEGQDGDSGSLRKTIYPQRCGRSPDRAARPTEGSRNRRRRPVGGFGGVGDPRRARGRNPTIVSKKKNGLRIGVRPFLRGSRQWRGECGECGNRIAAHSLPLDIKIFLASSGQDRQAPLPRATRGNYTPGVLGVTASTWLPGRRSSSEHRWWPERAGSGIRGPWARRSSPERRWSSEHKWWPERTEPGTRGP